MVDHCDNNCSEEQNTEFRDCLWNIHIDVDIYEYKCLCCNINTITKTNYEFGYIISETNGGTLNFLNIKLICFDCKQNLASNNMVDFITKDFVWMNYLK